MRRCSAVGQTARRWAMRPQLTTSFARVAVGRSEPVSCSARTFSCSALRAEKPKDTLKHQIDSTVLQEPNEAARKLFSDIAFAFEYVDPTQR